MITITWITVVVVALGLYLRQVYSKFSNLSVNHLPAVPFFGNLFWSIINFENIGVTLTKMSSTFPDDKVVGMYDMTTPLFIVQDIDTIKNITINDFDHFVDRRSFTTESDPIFGRVLLNLKGDEWKDMRATLSPAFTSSKIRLMVPFMVEVGEEMIKVLNQKINESGKNYIDVRLQDITTRYANDVIASCVFGLKVESQSVDSHFYLNAKDITRFTFVRLMKILIFRSFPFMDRILDLTLMSLKTSSFFRNVVLDTMMEREQKNIVRHDMINILNEIKRGKLSREKETHVDDRAEFTTIEESGVGKRVHNKVWTDTDLVGQAILFLLAGFDTVSSAMTFILHELAVNQEIQEKLVQEIQEYDRNHDGKIDFNSIQRMKYLNMVVSETLRLHPPITLADRKCVKEYNLGRVNKSSTQDLILRKGDVIGYPIWMFHHDPRLFSDPLKFDPERFSEENSHNIKPFSYMPFGRGPRSCIGSRFALCEIKVMLYILLRKMKVSPCEKTKIPLELANGLLMKIKDGGWIRLQVRYFDMIIVFLIVMTMVALALYFHQVHSNRLRMGVNHLPVIPFFGDIFWSLFRIENFGDTLTRISSAYPEDKIVGIYEMTNLVYMVKDLDTLKLIVIKAFDHFVDRRTFTSNLDNSFARGLFSLQDQEWKQMRCTLSPAFTSSKIRMMVPLMVEVGEEMIKVFNDKIKASREKYIDINLKDITSRYANDVIASCAFGLKVDSQSGNNQFYINAEDVSNFSLFRVVKVIFFRTFPSIAKMLKITISSKEASNFFTNVVLTTMTEREEKNIVRHDMINILNEIKRGKLIQEKETEGDIGAGFATAEESAIGNKLRSREWSDTDLVAQAIQFIFAGLDTVSTAMSFIIHELAVHPEVQERLVQEIKENDERNPGKFDFDSIKTMKYLDMVVSEGLRLYPPVQYLDRRCVKECNLGRVNKSSNKDLIMRNGDDIVFSIWTFHRNPQLFPDPLKFDPERFSEENRHNIKPFSYFPFGLGPRNCIGSRFALCEVKVMLYMLLRKFKVSPCEKTTIPIQLRKGFVTTIKNGGWVRVQVRQ